MAYNIEEINAELGSRARELAHRLFDRVKRRSSNEWRDKAEKIAIFRGRDGIWRYRDYGAMDRATDLIGGIQHHLGMSSRADAKAWALDFLGWPSDQAGAKPAEDVFAAAARELARQKRLQEQAKAQEAEAAAERAKKLTAVERLIASCVPISGTPAEAYIRDIRRIPEPAEGWGPDLLWTPERISFGAEGWSHALVVVARDRHGVVRGIQRIRLNLDGTREVNAETGKKAAKKSLGAMSGAVLRLPERPGAPSYLAICEGPETALSVWTATGAETVCTFMAKAALDLTDVPLERQLVRCMDDDPAKSNTVGPLLAQADELRAQGRMIACAWPWPERREDGSDFNDVLMALGPDEVSARVNIAIQAQPRPLEPQEPEPGLPVEEAHRIARQAVVEAIAVALAGVDESRVWDEGEEPPEHYDARWPDAGITIAVAPSVGLGKTEAAIAEITRRILAGELERVTFAVAEHGLSAEIKERFLKASGGAVRVAIHYGRNRPDPTSPGHRMCRRPEAELTEVHSIGGSVTDTLCKAKIKVVEVPAERIRLTDGTYRTIREERATKKEVLCPFYDTCGYNQQKDELADAQVVITAHASLFQPRPAAIRYPDMIVVDESPLPAAKPSKAARITFDGLRQSIPLVDIHGKPRHGDIVDLHQRLDPIRAKLLEAAEGAPLGFLSRAALVAAGLTEEDCAKAARALWDAVSRIDRYINPATPAADVRYYGRTVGPVNRRVRAEALMWGGLRDALRLRPDVAANPERIELLSRWAPERIWAEPEIEWHGIGQLEVVAGEDGVRHLAFRRPGRINKAWLVPSMEDEADGARPANFVLLDATLDYTTAQHVLPNLERDVVRVRAKAEHGEMGWVTGKSFSKASLLEAPGVAKRIGRVADRANAALGGRTLLVVQKDVETTIRDTSEAKGWGASPMVSRRDRVDVGHFNALRGQDAYGRVRTLLSFGRPAPAPQDVEADVAAISGWGVKRLGGDWYPAQHIARRATSGEVRVIKADRHPDQRVEAMRRAICDAEVEQVRGRARDVNRDATCPVAIVIAAGGVNPDAPIDYFIDWETISRADPDLDALVAEGAWALARTDLEKIAPGMEGKNLAKERQAVMDEVGVTARKTPIMSSYGSFTRCKTTSPEATALAVRPEITARQTPIVLPYGTLPSCKTTSPEAGPADTASGHGASNSHCLNYWDFGELYPAPSTLLPLEDASEAEKFTVTRLLNAAASNPDLAVIAYPAPPERHNGRPRMGWAVVDTARHPGDPVQWLEGRLGRKLDGAQVVRVNQKRPVIDYNQSDRNAPDVEYTKLLTIQSNSDGSAPACHNPPQTPAETSSAPAAASATQPEEPAPMPMPMTIPAPTPTPALPAPADATHRPRAETITWRDAAKRLGIAPFAVERSRRRVQRLNPGLTVEQAAFTALCNMTDAAAWQDLIDWLSRPAA